MNLELVRDNVNDETGAVAGRLFVDGAFFGYTLENKATAIEEGVYSLYSRFSPKFNSFKVSIDVPGRQYLMFHGGNTPDQSTGCVIVARERVSDSTVKGDLSGDLYNLLKDSLEKGKDSVSIRSKKNFLPVLAFVAAALYITLTR